MAVIGDVGVSCVSLWVVLGRGRGSGVCVIEWNVVVFCCVQTLVYSNVGCIDGWQFWS